MTRPWDVIGIGATSVDYVYRLPVRPPPVELGISARHEREERTQRLGCVQIVKQCRTNRCCSSPADIPAWSIRVAVSDAA